MTLYLQGKYFQNENFIQIFSESNMHLYVQTYVIFSHYIWLSGFNLDKTSFQAPSALFLTFKSQIKWSESRSVMSNSLQHHGLAHGILQARILEWVALPFSRGSSQPRDWTQVSCTSGGFLPAEPRGKPKNTGVDGLSLLQGIFQTQELNMGLLHCRRIL